MNLKFDESMSMYINTLNRSNFLYYKIRTFAKILSYHLSTSTMVNPPIKCDPVVQDNMWIRIKPFNERAGHGLGIDLEEEELKGFVNEILVLQRQT